MVQIAALAERMDRPRLAGHFASAEALQAPLLADIRAGDVIMIKASNGLKFARLVDAIRERFAQQAEGRVAS